MLCLITASIPLDSCVTLSNGAWALVQEIISKDNEKLRQLKEEHGEEMYALVTKALDEVYNYKPCAEEQGGEIYGVPELWNYKADRRATVKEGIQYALEKWATKKRKRWAQNLAGVVSS